ncbi:MAG: undecaprenyl-diphosphate phosphatase [Bacteroidetes bacterium]|nr:undecaprenyl-diphosphate phosphatase [Bacteroidota bacterium]
MGLIEALILAFIEGLTEFIPVSSTGHIIIASSIMGIKSDDFVKLFTVGIQFGSILAVIILYFKHFFQTLRFYYKLFVAFIPAAVFGVLFKSQIDEMLENVVIVAIALIAGGIILVFIDKIFNKEKINNDEEISYKSAFIIGFFQTISMVPGISRSAATIIGGLIEGLSRKKAAEFSFFLAVPTMFGATAKSLFDYFENGLFLNNEQIKIFTFGNIVAFVVSVIAIKFMISIVVKYGFKIFGYYRIILGLIILILYFTGSKLSIID